MTLRKTIAAIFMAVLAALLFAGAAAAPSSDYSAFIGKKLGVQMGTICDTVAQGHMQSEPAYYSDNSAGIEDVRQGRIDGYIADLSVLRVLTAMPENGDLTCHPIPAEIFIAPMGGYSLDQGVIDRFNVFLAAAEADGTVADMQARWLETVPDSSSPMPDIPLVGGNGTLRVATNGGALPFSYIGAGGELKGYSIELARRFAAHEGMEIEFFEMDFSAMIPYIVAGRAELGIANVSITEERSKSVIFTEPIYNDQLAVIALNQNAGAAREKLSFGEWLQTGIQNNLITESRWMMIVNGLGVTMIIAVLAQIFGTAFGCLVCWTLMHRSRLVRGLGNLYCGLIHGTPIVVLLMITYYIIFGDTDVSNVLTAVAAFTFITGAGVAGTLKGAIDTVDPVEIEAARSIGFSAVGAFFTVTLPQAVRRALPGYMNGFVELVKATAIVGYIAIQDLTRAGDIIRSRTYDAYFPLLFVAVIYLLVTTLCVQALGRVIRKINGGEAA